MKILALTGRLASGKSTVAKLVLEQLSTAELLDADAIVRELYTAPPPDLVDALISRFGATAQTDSGTIDAQQLRDLVLADPANLIAVGDIVQPFVRAEIRSRLAASTAPLIIIEASHLLQSGLCQELKNQYKTVTSWAAICADQTRRLERAGSRGLTAEQLAQFDANQLSDGDFASQVDTTINTAQPLAATRVEVIAALNRL